MKRLVELERSAVPGGHEMILCRRQKEFVIMVNGVELMGSGAHASEEKLASIACQGLRLKSGVRILIGGLGMGYTVRAALRVLGPDAHVDVAELVPAVVRWNRGVLGPIAGAPLEDLRVHVIEEDVAQVLKDSESAYDAVLLDVDNGPAALTSPLNARLYDAAGLLRSYRALRPSGVLAIWSTSDDPAFTERVTKAGFRTRIERPTARAGGSARHVVWVAKKAAHVAV